MTKDEVMKLALEALQADELDMVDDGSGNMIFRKEQAITAIKEALAQPAQEPVVWPCLIDSADFSVNTITLVMQCKDYKVSAGTHYLSTTPPQPTWVGLTDEERKEIWWSCEQQTPTTFVKAIEQALKEKNT